MFVSIHVFHDDKRKHHLQCFRVSSWLSPIQILWKIWKWLLKICWLGYCLGMIGHRWLRLVGGWVCLISKSDIGGMFYRLFEHPPPAKTHESLETHKTSPPEVLESSQNGTCHNSVTQPLTQQTFSCTALTHKDFVFGICSYMNFTWMHLPEGISRLKLFLEDERFTICLFWLWSDFHPRILFDRLLSDLWQTFVRPLTDFCQTFEGLLPLQFFSAFASPLDTLPLSCHVVQLHTLHLDGTEHRGNLEKITQRWGRCERMTI